MAKQKYKKRLESWDLLAGTLINLSGEKIKFGREGEADLLFE